MQTYLALLRGINVSGQKIIKMENLRKLMGDAGFENVETYIQSGNIIFDFRKTSKTDLAQKIKELIKVHYGFDVGVIILDNSELNHAIKNNPFINPEANLKQLYVTFLSGIPTADNAANWHESKIEPDQAVIDGKVMYLKYFAPAGNSKLTNVLIEKRLRVVATSRNWNTTLKLEQMLDDRARTVKIQKSP